MPSGRPLLLAALVAVIAGVLLGVASRTPAEVRERRSPPSAADPALGSSFTDEQVARHGAYRRAGYISFVLFTLVQIVVLVALARGPVARLAERMNDAPGGWVGRAVVVAAAVAVALALASLPLAFVRGYVIEHAWGLSTQDVGGWVSDQAKGLAISIVVSAVAAVAFYGVIRAAPKLWWVLGWLAFSVLTAALTFLWPVAIAPLFNEFQPLEDDALVARIEDLAEEAGIPLETVLVADAARRTTAENAYVAGLGATKRMVLYDTLLAGHSPDETAFVAAHELAHQAEGHVSKSLAFASAGLLTGFAILALALSQPRLLQWAGAAAPEDVKTLPLVLLLAALMGLAALPAQNALSRHFEGRADRIAVELTDDPEAAVSSLRKLALNNLADLRPPAPAVWLLYTHPPVPARIRAIAGQSAFP